MNLRLLMVRDCFEQFSVKNYLTYETLMVGLKSEKNLMRKMSGKIAQKKLKSSLTLL